VLRRIVALLLLAALAACSKTSVATQGGAHNPWTTPGVLRVGDPQEPDSMNLMFGNNSATDQLTSLVYSFLLRVDDRGNLIPDLATEVPTRANGGISADGKTIVLHLRHGVRWADGIPLDANDWMFTYHAVNNPRNNVKSRYGWDQIASASAPDKYTLVVHFKHPSVAAFDIFTMGGTAYPPLPAHALDGMPDINHAEINAAPLSSGPYVLRHWIRNDSLEFVPNPLYWRGAPRLNELIWKIVPDTNTLMAELRAHEIDVYPYVDARDVGQLRSIQGVTVVHRLIANWRHLGINLKNPLLADVRVRRAIAYGINWKRINDTVYHGVNQLAVSDVFPESWAAPSLPPYAYDPEKARALLAQAGWTRGKDGFLHRDGQTLRLTISASTAARTNEESEVVMQSALRELGIDVQIRNYPPSQFFASDGPLRKGTYDLEWSIDTNGADPDNAGSWNSAYIPPNGANTSWLRDPEIDRLSAAAAATYDPRERKALYQKEEERLRDLVPAVFFYWEMSYYGVNSDLRGFKPSPYLTDTWNAWEWQI
jgi:peptide/nickel transport system substrate-binding protein